MTRKLITSPYSSFYKIFRKLLTAWTLECYVSLWLASRYHQHLSTSHWNFSQIAIIPSSRLLVLQSRIKFKLESIKENLCYLFSGLFISTPFLSFSTEKIHHHIRLIRILISLLRTSQPCVLWTTSPLFHPTVMVLLTCLASLRNSTILIIQRSISTKQIGRAH